MIVRTPPSLRFLGIAAVLCGGLCLLLSAATAGAATSQRCGAGDPAGAGGACPLAIGTVAPMRARGAPRISVVTRVTSRRHRSDSFAVWVTSSTGRVLGRADAGTGNRAAAGPFILAAGPNASYTLTNVANPGSRADLALYEVSWSCTDRGSPYPVTPSAGGTVVAFSPQAGDQIVCTVTDTVPVVSGSLLDPLSVTAGILAAGALGVGWFARRRHGKVVA